MFCRSKNVQFFVGLKMYKINVHFVRQNMYGKCWEILVKNPFSQLEIAVFWSIQSVICGLTKNSKFYFCRHALSFTTQAPSVQV